MALGWSGVNITLHILATEISSQLCVVVDLNITLHILATEISSQLCVVVDLNITLCILSRGCQ